MGHQKGPAEIPGTGLPGIEADISDSEGYAAKIVLLRNYVSAVPGKKGLRYVFAVFVDGEPLLPVDYFDGKPIENSTDYPPTDVRAGSYRDVLVVKDFDIKNYPRIDALCRDLTLEKVPQKRVLKRIDELWKLYMEDLGPGQ